MESDREVILKETYNYKGNMFWENYMLSNIVRTVAKDLNEFENPELVAEFYTTLYGEDSAELFEDMINNKEVLTEAAKVKGVLLFESTGEENVKAYLNEVAFSSVGLGGVVSNVATGTAKKQGKEVALGVLGGKFLRGLWSKFKGIFSKGNFTTIGDFLRNGFDWAKNLVQGGINWVSKSPFLSTIVPILMVVGTVAGAKALLNKLRKKAGKGKMSRSEEVSFERVAKKNADKVKKAREKVLN